MTQREKVLAGMLVVLLVFVGGAVAGYLFVYRPLSAVNAQLKGAEAALKKKEAELAAEEQQIESLLRVNPRLSQWTKLSLPPRDPTAKKVPVALQEEQKKKHLNTLQVDYEKYLHTLLSDSGLKEVKVDPRQIERRTTNQAFKGAQPAHERLAFGASARGTMASVTKALREFHKTPLLQQVKNLTLSAVQSQGSAPVPPGTLDVKLTVEALVVAGGEERVGLLPSKLAYEPRVLAEPRRDYDALAGRNMFTGFSTAREDRGNTRTEKREDVLRFVKLTMLAYNPSRGRWEATIYDQAKGGAEKRLAPGVVLSGMTILDRYKNPVLEAKVVHVDESQLVFLEGKKYYRMSCGDMVWAAMKKEMPRGEVKALGVDTDEAEKEDKDDAAEEG